MADYPTTVFDFRDIENLPGIVYDSLKKQNLFAEDILAIVAEIIAIETLLGVSGSYLIPFLSGGNSFSDFQGINYTDNVYMTVRSLGVGAPTVHPALAGDVEVFLTSRSNTRKTLRISKKSGQTANLLEITGEYGNGYVEFRANGSVAFNGTILPTNNIQFQGSNYYSFGISGSDVFIRNDSSGVYGFIQKTSGKIGIGTNAPAYDCDIVGEVNARTGFRVGGTAGVSGSFTTADGKTVTVTKGLITSII